MKSKILWLLIFPLVLLSALVSCDQEGYKGRYVLELDKDSVTIDVKGKGEDVYVRSNGDWKIEDMPEWLHVSPDRGPYSTHIAIWADSNKETNERKATLVFTYGNGSKTLEVVQLRSEKEEPDPDKDDIMSFEPNSVSIDILGGISKVMLTTRYAWELKNVPAWLQVWPSSGYGSTEITIQAKENRSPGERMGALTFEAEGEERMLIVSQKGRKDIFIFPLLSIFSYQHLEISTVWDRCKIQRKSMFINPDIQEKVYLGSLVSPKMESNTNLPEFAGYTFNPVHVSSFLADDVKGVEKTYIPSKVEQDALAKQVMAEELTPVSLNIESNGYEYYTHRDLCGMGLLNVGVKLDEVIYGSSFVQKEMTRKYGLVLAFKKIMFSLATDSPEKLVKEELTNADKAKGVSYVSAVTYGKVGLLVIESTVDSRDVRDVIDKVLDNQSLSKEETDLLYSADIWYVYFNNDGKVQTMKGDKEAVLAYKEAMEGGTHNIYPVEFQLSDYANHSLSSISYSVTLPK